MKLMSYVAFAAFLQTLVWIGLCWYYDPKSKLNRAAIIPTVFFAFWSFCLIFVYGSNDMAQALEFYHLQYWGLVFVVPFETSFYLQLARQPRRQRVLVMIFAVSFGVLHLAEYSMGNYYYQAFVPGPWGNVGQMAHGQNQGVAILPAVAPFVWFLLASYAAFVLFRASSKSPSRRFRAQVRWALFGIFSCYFVYFAAWIAESIWPLPPLEFLAGTVVISINCYLLTRYRYLRPDNDLLEKHVGGIFQNSSLLVDPQRRVLAGNRSASNALGLYLDTMLGNDLAGFVSPERLVQLEWDLAKNRKPVSRYIPCQLAGFSVLLSFTPFFDRRGHFGGCVVLLANLEPFDRAAERYRLSAREKALALLVLQGASNHTIAGDLNIAVGTVRRHLSNIFEKIECQSRNELIVRLTT